MRKQREIEEKVYKQIETSRKGFSANFQTLYFEQIVEEESQKRIELLIKKRVDTILEMRKQEIESEIKQRVSIDV